MIRNSLLALVGARLLLTAGAGVADAVGLVVSAGTLLTDGTQLILHSGVAAQQDHLRPGARIKASYAETAGRKVVTSIEIMP